jgi:hypothetical protein
MVIFFLNGERGHQPRGFFTWEETAESILAHPEIYQGKKAPGRSLGQHPASSNFLESAQQFYPWQLGRPEAWTIKG